MHVPTWEGDLHPLRPESPHCPGGRGLRTLDATDGASGGGGAVALRLAGGVASELRALTWSTRNIFCFCGRLTPLGPALPELRRRCDRGLCTRVVLGRLLLSGEYGLDHASHFSNLTSHFFNLTSRVCHVTLDVLDHAANLVDLVMEAAAMEAVLVVLVLGTVPVHLCRLRSDRRRQRDIRPFRLRGGRIIRRARLRQQLERRASLEFQLDVLHLLEGLF